MHEQNLNQIENISTQKWHIFPYLGLDMLNIEEISERIPGGLFPGIFIKISESYSTKQNPWKKNHEESMEEFQNGFVKKLLN